MIAQFGKGSEIAVLERIRLVFRPNSPTSPDEKRLITSRRESALAPGRPCGTLGPCLDRETNSPLFRLSLSTTQRVEMQRYPQSALHGASPASNRRDR